MQHRCALDPLICLRVLDEVCVLFLIQRRWMADSDGAGPDDDEYDKLDYIPSVSVRISSHFRQFTRTWPDPKYSYFTEKEEKSFLIKRF